MRFVAGRDAVAKLLPAVALRRRAIGKMLLAGGAIGKRLMAEVALRRAIGKRLLAGPPKGVQKAKWLTAV